LLRSEAGDVGGREGSRGGGESGGGGGWGERFRLGFGLREGGLEMEARQRGWGEAAASG